MGRPAAEAALQAISGIPFQVPAFGSSMTHVMATSSYLLFTWGIPDEARTAADRRRGEGTSLVHDLPCCKIPR